MLLPIRTFIVLAFGLAHVQSLLVPLPVEEQCLKESNTTREELYDKINEAKIEGNADKVEMKYMCYVSCAAAAIQIVDENDQLNIEKFQEIEKLMEDNLAVVEVCHEKHSSTTDKCVYAFNMLLCYIMNYNSLSYINIGSVRE